MVVSPYNMQVELLKRTLPDGARVGTVDKFQGLEAPVALVSMATSSADDLPRNIEFLNSRNRMNVAISRARCLAVIFANPRLLEIPCSTIAQMERVDGLCWAKHFADEQKAAATAAVDAPCAITAHGRPLAVRVTRGRRRRVESDQGGADGPSSGIVGVGQAIGPVALGGKETECRGGRHW